MTAVKMQLFFAPLFFATLGLSHPSFQLLRTREISPDNTCGTKGVGGSAAAYTCPPELPCCSVNGFCGSTSEYCCAVTGCQEDFGDCKAGLPPESPPSPPDEGETKPATGGDPERCGRGIGSCAAGKCCSLAGYCGTTQGESWNSMSDIIMILTFLERSLSGTQLSIRVWPRL